ncbi:MAG: AAA family ATPase, partial [Anaerolineae bacterium]|nr:AAA family ATPase [Anaerolineae bacterium]
MQRFERSDPLATLQPVAEADELLQMQDAIRTVRMEKSVSDYLIKLCRKTRGATGAQLGVSPRG